MGRVVAALVAVLVRLVLVADPVGPGGSADPADLVGLAVGLSYP